MSQQLKSAVRERPILFSGPMVRAILEGRKTQTRRVVKPQFPDDYSLVEVGTYHPTVIVRGEEEPGPETFGAWTDDGEFAQPCPYGQPGDRLWVRETWAAWATVGAGDLWRVRYDADGKYDDFRLPTESDWMPPKSLRVDRPTNAPSIFMPRWASRLTLEITEVRVQRLGEISEEDANAEGYRGEGPTPATAREEFLTGEWARSLPGKQWEEQRALWVWAISFKPIEPSGSSRRQRGEANG